MMTDNDIIKALECCLKGDYDKIINALCAKCPYCKNTDCKLILQQDSLDLINRQKAEIERLNIRNKTLTDITKNYDWKFAKAKSEAIKELREKCIEHQDFHKGDDGVFRGYIAIEDLDYIISEVSG